MRLASRGNTRKLCQQCSWAVRIGWQVPFCLHTGAFDDRGCITRTKSQAYKKRHQIELPMGCKVCLGFAAWNICVASVTTLTLLHGRPDARSTEYIDCSSVNPATPPPSVGVIQRLKPNGPC
eukprot:scaffold824_cov327-Pavlova_lutheri.AAC.38